jgi:hypothetical protein
MIRAPKKVNVQPFFFRFSLGGYLETKTPGSESLPPGGKLHVIPDRFLV